MIKCADVSHPARMLHVHERWSDLISDEFYLQVSPTPWVYILARARATRIVCLLCVQGDRERELGMPISPLCDRNSHNLAKSQIGFIDFVVKPSFAILSAFCDTEEWMDVMKSNLRHWKGLAATAHLSNSDYRVGSRHVGPPPPGASLSQDLHRSSVRLPPASAPETVHQQASVDMRSNSRPLHAPSADVVAAIPAFSSTAMTADGPAAIFGPSAGAGVMMSMSGESTSLQNEIDAVDRRSAVRAQVIMVDPRGSNPSQPPDPIPPVKGTARGGKRRSTSSEAAQVKGTGLQSDPQSMGLSRSGLSLESLSNSRDNVRSLPGSIPSTHNLLAVRHPPTIAVL